MVTRVVFVASILVAVGCSSAKKLPATLTLAVTGAGTVTSFPAGIDCPTGCTAQLTVGAQVALFAQPTAGSVVSSWSYAGCTGELCVVTLAADTSVSVAFVPATTPATVTVTVTGPGSVISVPSGITCGTSCTGTFIVGQQIALMAEPNADSTLSSWSNASCSGTVCALTLTADTSVSATFAPIQPPTATVSVVAAGPGTVTSYPARIDCGTSCTGTFLVGETVSLYAQPNAGALLTGWSGATCSGPLCGVTVTANTTITATFALSSALNVSVGGTGQGTVTSGDGNIDCPGSCSESTAPSAMVTLTAVPTGAYYFLGWFGSGCTGNQPTCTVTVNGPTAPEAVFSGINWLSTVDPADPTQSIANTNIWLSDGAGGNAHALTSYSNASIDDAFGCALSSSADGTLFAVGGNVSPDGADTYGNSDNVFLVNAITGAVSPITAFEQASADCASISPDGKKAYYVSNYDPTSTSPTEATLAGNAEQVWSSNVDGTGAQPISGSIGLGYFYPVLSPNGATLALQVQLAGSASSTATSPWTLWVMGSDGTNAQQVTSVYGANDNFGALYAMPTWSPDSTKFAYASYQSVSTPTMAQSTANIWVYDVSTATAAPITSFTGGSYIIDPIWSPDGQSIAFDMNVEPGQPGVTTTSYLYTVSASGGTPVPLTMMSFDQQHAPVWAPDSSTVFFTSQGLTLTGVDNIWSAPPDGSTAPATVTTFSTGSTFTSTYEWD